MTDSGKIQAKGQRIAYIVKASLLFNRCVMNVYCVPGPVHNTRCIKYTNFKACYAEGKRTVTF